MKISQKGLYALQAMMMLARHYNQGAIRIRDIAYEEELPEKFLELILLELKNARMVESVRGAKGGYQLRRAPSEIHLSEIIRLIDGPLDVAAVLHEVEDPEAGAVASFVGTVRRRSRERDVVHLEYEAFEEMAEPMLARLGEELTARHGLCAVAVHHRLGRVEVGEASVVIAVSAPHRSAALDACREAIETLKTTIPLWKKEVYAGGEEWIGRGS